VVETVAAVAMVALTIGLVGAWISLRRHPERWSEVLSERFWRRWIGWTVALTVAAGIGAAAGGETLLVPIGATGAASLLFGGSMWLEAR
jgi:hypothetical protein